MVYVVHVYYNVVFKVSRNQTMYFVVHVDYDVLSNVILDQDKFVIVEAVLNIIVQAAAFARVFFST